MRRKRKLIKAAAMSAAALVLGAGFALADTVTVNDLVTGGNVTKAPGTTGSAKVMLLTTNGTPAGDTDGCNAQTSNPVVVTLGSNNAGVTFPAGNTASLTGCDPSPGSSANVGYSVATGASGTATISITSVTGGKRDGTRLFNTADTLVITIDAPADTTPPTIGYTLNPASPDGDNDWYRSNVTLTWSVTENDSPGSLVKTGCVNQNITADQGATNYSCSATSDGGSAGPVNVSIKRDSAPPSISFDGYVPATPDGDNGWYTSNVDAKFSASDSLSGVNGSATETKTISSEGTGLTATSSSFGDNAGNSAAGITSSPAIKVDKTAPVTSVTGVSDGATYTLGSVPTAGCSSTDAISGVAQEATASLTGGPVDSVMATCSGAEDFAGNDAADAAVTYSVIYNWTGFFRPVDNGGILNSVKAGQAIPVKFSLDGNQGLDIMATGYPSSRKVDCATGTDIDPIESTITAGQSSLSYDTLTDQYNYLWKSDKAWAGSCRKLTVMTNDGVSHTALFKFTK